MCFSGHCLCQQSLTGSGRSHQKSPLGKLCTNGGIFHGIMQEIHHFLQRLFGFILTGHIFKCHTCFFLYIGFCFALAYASSLTHDTHLFHQPVHSHNQKQERNQQRNDRVNHGTCGIRLDFIKGYLLSCLFLCSRQTGSQCCSFFHGSSRILKLNPLHFLIPRHDCQHSILKHH